MTIAVVSRARPFARPSSRGAVPLAVTGAILIGMVGRAAYSWHAPLWLDETYSAVIAGQRDWRHLIDWCLFELTGPGYYVPLWAWARLAGTGDLMLRLPSLVIALATPLLVFGARGIDRDTRLAWAAALALWLPGFAVAGEARGYALLLMLGVAQIVALRSLIEAPSTRRAALWLALSGWMMLINYWSALPALAQGLVYLAAAPRRAIATWPAAIVMLPVAGWMAVHLPGVIGATMGSLGGGPIHAGLDWRGIGELPAMLLGTSPLGWGTIVLVAASLIAGRGTRMIGVSMAPDRAGRLIALAALIGIGFTVALAIARPGFSARYATAAVPGLLFALACWARWARHAAPRALIGAAILWLASGLGLVAAILGGPDRDARHRFQLETPSAWIAEKAPDAALIFWDGAIASRGDPRRIGEIGGYFLRRSGAPVAISVAMPARIDDPNRAFAAWLGRHPRAGLLWFANEAVGEARQPGLPAKLPHQQCRNFGGEGVIVYACRPLSPSR